MSNHDIISEHMRMIGAKGGKATAKILNAGERSALARKAARAKWRKYYAAQRRK
jgi:hypothetical protein